MARQGYGGGGRVTGNACWATSRNASCFSLALNGKLTALRPSHLFLGPRQYHYVLQSLTLWREISTEMFKLWYLAESDMLREGNTYRLCDTGQGLNRVQSAPQVGRAMQQILNRCADTRPCLIPPARAACKCCSYIRAFPAPGWLAEGLPCAHVLPAGIASAMTAAFRGTPCLSCFLAFTRTPALR